MTNPTDRNRLRDASSPYLQQHADNPVHWQPWDPEALTVARERDLPIFLSIGYSACHWCHVMEDESFKNERVAQLLNEGFVSIKIDREERPDIDSIYQTICQLVTGNGGWPLSVWTTPDGRPFYVGTYFPIESRGSMPGFLDILSNIQRSWTEDRDEIESRADQWTRAITEHVEVTSDTPAAVPGNELLETAADAALRSADREHGGFGRSGPKFPQTPRLELLMRAFDRTGRDAYYDVVTETLDAMSNRGLYDHIGGGFHRYATDRAWTIPHFEKMLYDNAEIPKAFVAGYQLTGEERYERVVRETFGFLDRELTHPSGGFFSTLDAQSEGTEGAFYVWTPDSVYSVIDDDDLASMFCDRYGVETEGNFEGSTVLTVSKPIEALATEYNSSPAEIRDRLDEAKYRLFVDREDRERPGRDEKILAGWNGLAVSALAEAGLVFDDAYLTMATNALSFVREHHWDPDRNRLFRRFKDGNVGIDGYLEDYAFVARGAFDLYQVSGSLEHLVFAVDLARSLIAEFWDPDAATLYFTPESGERLVARTQEFHDQSTPSSLGVAVDVLHSLTHFSTNDDFAEIVESTIATHGNRVRSDPLHYTSLVLAADRFVTGALEFTIVADQIPETWRSMLGTAYLPGRIISRRPPETDDLDWWIDELGLDESPPIWRERHQQDHQPTCYVCRSHTCSPPITDIEAAIEWATSTVPSE